VYKHVKSKIKGNFKSITQAQKRAKIENQERELSTSKSAL